MKDSTQKYQLITDNEKAEAVRDYARQTIGSENMHRDPLHPRGFQYTDGIEFVAETCGAYWLIDLVASHQPKICRKHPCEASFQVWVVRPLKTKEGFSAECWSDTPDHPESKRLAYQSFGYSDFPRELMPFEFWVEWVEYGTMMLKEER